MAKFLIPVTVVTETVYEVDGVRSRTDAAFVLAEQLGTDKAKVVKTRVVSRKVGTPATAVADPLEATSST